MSLRIIIADDHPVVRIGARSVIEASGIGEVVAEASSPQVLMAALANYECDVLVTDYSMPDANLPATSPSLPDGFAMINMIRRHYPALPILMLSVSSNLAILRMVREAGVLGLVDKGSPMEELPTAIRVVHRGQRYISQSLQGRVEAAGSTTIEESESRRLSPREIEVLRLLGEGKAVKEIAELLHRSASTISRQKGDAMLKLGLKSDAALFDYLRSGRH